MKKLLFLAILSIFATSRTWTQVRYDTTGWTVQSGVRGGILRTFGDETGQVFIDTCLTCFGGGGGSGTVTSVSVVNANGISGTVANPTTTPAITLIPDSASFWSLLGLGTASNHATGDFVLSNGAITGATKTKITYDAKGLVTSGANATTADIAASTDKNYVTDAQAVVIGNTSGTNSGDQTITLTSDVTGTGTGSFATTIAAGVVTLAKMANMATSSLIYRKTAGSGAPEVNTLATLKTDLLLTGTNSGDQTISLTGGVTGSGAGSFAATVITNANLTGDVTSVGNATTIGNDKVLTANILNSNVTLAKIANIADQTILGNNTGGSAAPLALTASQTKTILSLGSVENTALSTWAGTTNITTLGTIATGVWSGTAIAYNKLALTGAILNADLAGSIAYSKLSLTGAILNADLAGSIAASKLVGSDIATVGTITSGTWHGTAIGSSYIADLGANPSASLGLAAVNGSATTYMRSDGAPALSVAIIPVWTGLHSFNAAGIASTYTNKILVENTTAATSGATLQQSASLEFLGHYWGTTATAADSTAAFTQTLIPTSAAGRAPFTLTWQAGNGGTDMNTVMTLSNAGVLTATTFTGALSGNATSATSAATLTTPRTINGTSFNGSANITVTADASTLTGTTLNSPVVASSLTSVGTLTSLTVGSASGLITSNAGLLTFNTLASGSIPYGASTTAATANSTNLTYSATTGMLDRVSDAGTNTALVVSTLTHNSSGVIAAGFGTGLLFNGQSTTTADRNIAEIDAAWGTATDASRIGNMVFQVSANTAIANCMSLLGSATVNGLTSSSVLTVGNPGSKWGAIRLSTANSATGGTWLQAGDGTTVNILSFPSTTGAAGQVLYATDAAVNFAWSVPTLPLTASATSRKIIASDGTNWVASTETWAVPGANTGAALVGNGTNWTSQPTGWISTKVAGSNVTTTGTSLTNATGLSFTGVASTNYDLDAWLQVTCSGTGGIEFGANSTGTSPTVLLHIDGVSSITSNVGTRVSSFVNANNTPETVVMCTTAATTMLIHVYGLVGSGSGSPTVSIQYKSVTSGQTSTVLIGSSLNYRVH